MPLDIIIISATVMNVIIVLVLEYFYFILFSLLKSLINVVFIIGLVFPQDTYHIITLLFVSFKQATKGSACKTYVQGLDISMAPHNSAPQYLNNIAKVVD